MTLNLTNQQPSIFAAIVAAIVAILTLGVNGILNSLLHHKRLKTDRELAQRRFDYDRSLLDQRFKAESALAERRFDYERRLAEQKLAADRAAITWAQKVEFAEIALTSFYEAQSKLKHVRSPFSIEDESVERRGRDAEDAETRRIRDGYFPVRKRLDNYVEFFNNLMTQRFRAIALFGPEAEGPYDKIWSAVIEIQTSVDMLLYHYATSGSFTEMHDPQRRSMQEAIWANGPKDKVNTTVIEGVVLAESLFGAVLRVTLPN